MTSLIGEVEEEKRRRYQPTQGITDYQSVVAAGESEIFTKLFDDYRPKVIDLDSQFWANYYLGALGYIPNGTEYAFTVPAGTAVDTTYLVADGKVIRNWLTNSPVDDTPSTPPPDLLGSNTALVLNGNLTFTGATGIGVNAIIIPPLTRDEDIPEGRTLSDIINLWKQYKTNTLLVADATGSATVPISNFDPTGLKCRDIALVIKVTTSPAAATTVRLGFTGKKVQHKWE